MELIDILRANAEYTRNSNVEVDYDSAYGWVSIHDADDKGNGVFLQGDEGYAWIDEMRRVWEEVGDMGEDEVCLALAYDYLDCLQ